MYVRTGEAEWGFTGRLGEGYRREGSKKGGSLWKCVIIIL